MSAETLRKAANLMRERAEAATPGPWSNRRGPDEQVVRTDTGTPLARTSTRVDRRHIASWHPAVALAVADWLDKVAESVEFAIYDQHDDAMQIARAYLGESA